MNTKNLYLNFEKWEGTINIKNCTRIILFVQIKSNVK